MSHIKSALLEVREKLGLNCRHFLCGISQIACGGDMVFARACQSFEEPILQRILLPQPLEDYLEAIGSEGPDFSEHDKRQAIKLLSSPNIIQQRVASWSTERSDRFRHTNAEIARISDVVICLIGEAESDKKGGTIELLNRAKEVGIPAMEIRIVESEQREISFQNVWHLDDSYTPPRIPSPLDKLETPVSEGSLPTSEEYCFPLKEMVSTQAKLQQKLFKYAAALIIGAHILATMCATSVLALHGSHHPTSVVAPSDVGGEQHDQSNQQHSEESGSHTLVFSLLGIEVLLLGLGFLIHQYLHHSNAARVWANARVVAELARSIQVIHPRHLYLEYMFRLPLPRRFRPLLRTLSVLHLRSTSRSVESWLEIREKYIENRIDDQIDFYSSSLEVDRRRLKLFHRLFLCFSSIAILATTAKIAAIYALNPESLSSFPSLLGFTAIVAPVLAVAALSWLAALDCEARVETFEENLAFLIPHRNLLVVADTPDEFDQLMIEAETELLGEVANWFSRRANTGVA